MTFRSFGHVDMWLVLHVEVSRL